MALAAMNQVLMVAAHPDDEVFGCSVTIARQADFGDQLLIVVKGSTLRQPEFDSSQVRDELSALAKTAQTAGPILGGPVCAAPGPTR